MKDQIQSDEDPLNNDSDSDAFSQSLRSQLFRLDCPTEHQLGDYYLKLLDRVEQERVMAHLSDCFLCRESLDILHSFLEGNKPNSGLSQVKDPVRYFPTSPFSFPAVSRSLRGGSDGIQELNFKTENGLKLSLILGLREERVGYTLHGQFDSENGEEEIFIGADINIIIENKETILTKIDDLGSFKLSLEANVPFTLIVINESTATLLRKVDLRSSTS